MEIVIHFLGPLHPPLVHFAVVCPILAFFFLLAGALWKESWLSLTAASLWIFTFLSAIGAILSGHLFSLHLGMVSQWSFLPPESAVKGHLRDHALLGTIAFLASFLTLWAAIGIFRGKSWPKGFQLFSGLIVAVLFGLTGHEGGEMVYGLGENPAQPPAAVLSNASNPLALALNYRQTFVKMNSKMWNSRTHGHRWVNTYVSPQAVQPYKNANFLPEGSLVVKESFENVSGKPSKTPGPLYVMLKGKISDSPETGGWQYALSWEKPVPDNPEGIKMPVKWLSGDPHLNSCVKCHRHFKSMDYLGGVPDGYENP